MRTVFAGFAVLLMLAWSLAFLLGPASATFSRQRTNGGNTLSTDTLAAPTSLLATGGSSIALNWTATSDTYASGHRIFRGTVTGGPYSQIAEVTPRSTSIYIDDPLDGTYFYVARAYYQNWESANSNQASASKSTITSTGFRNCSANAAVTVSSGDNNGYEVTPASACTDDANFALDTASGTGNAGSCTNTAKDRHLFYDYGFAIPSGSTLNGIEVRLDAKADATTGSPHMCVELSWNGGTTWTTAKTGANLGVTESTIILGSASDNWGRTWSAGDFSMANFRVRVTDVASNTSRTFSLEWVAVQVTYTPP